MSILKGFALVEPAGDCRILRGVLWAACRLQRLRLLLRLHGRTVGFGWGSSSLRRCCHGGLRLWSLRHRLISRMLCWYRGLCCCLISRSQDDRCLQQTPNLPCPEQCFRWYISQSSVCSLACVARPHVPSVPKASRCTRTYVQCGVFQYKCIAAAGT